jgi:Ferritin-like domain
MYKLNLDEIDVDGAIREQGDAVSGDTRLDFIRKGALGAGAVVGGGALLGVVGPAAAAGPNTRPPKAFGKGDIGILNFALTLEYLEAAFYTEALNAGAVKDPLVAAFLKTVEKDERAHVSYLKKALGAKAVKKPKFDFKGTTKDEAKFRATSQVLENTGVHAYLGQAKNISSKTILGAAGSILTIEARHASVIGFLNSNTPKGIAPDGPFDKPFSAAAVLKAVKGTGFIVG